MKTCATSSRLAMRPFTFTRPLVGAVTREKNLEQSAFAGAIATNEPNVSPCSTFETHIFKRKDGFALAITFGLTLRS